MLLYAFSPAFPGVVRPTSVPDIFSTGFWGFLQVLQPSSHRAAHAWLYHIVFYNKRGHVAVPSFAYAECSLVVSIIISSFCLFLSISFFSLLFRPLPLVSLEDLFAQADA
ncbi:hypothetical protein COU79_01130, partial [Candidatus Peregrinibacteria bacterium CG10_big_fil_rev_8_21_14_0_10_54_7]